MEERLKEIEQDIQDIKDRNSKVGAEKAWEVSLFRKVSIAAITYIIASVAMYFIGVSNYLLSALIPTLGYILSTQSLPLLKQWWIRRNFPAK
ncbi:MAG: hypothetical protein JWO73_140 [Candidatus Taylorbacteria bacterium]|nr:hypothetical protein [Candidatus Taylorbacteria bacterium]